MFNKFDFTVDKKTFKDLPEFVDELHQNGQRYVIIVVSGIFKKKNMFMSLLPHSIRILEPHAMQILVQ